MDDGTRERIAEALTSALDYIETAGDGTPDRQLVAELESARDELLAPSIYAEHLTLERAARGETAWRCVEAAKVVTTREAATALLAAAVVLAPEIVADLNDRDDWPPGDRWDRILDDAREVALAEGLVERIEPNRGRTGWGTGAREDTAFAGCALLGHVRTEFLSRLDDEETDRLAKQLEQRLLDITLGRDRPDDG